MSPGGWLPGAAVIVEAYRTYPLRSAFNIGCILVAGLAEGLGVAAVFPVLATAVEGTGGSQSEIGRIVTETLASLGLPVHLGGLLLLMVAAFAAKGGLMMVAMQQIGFTSAHVSTDLRFALIRAVMAAKWSYFANQPIGHLGNAVSVEATRGGAAFTGAYTIVAMAIQVAVYLGLAMFVSWPIALASLGAGVVMMIILGRFIGMTRRASAAASVAFQELLRQVTDALHGIKPLKAMAVQGRVVALLESEASDINATARRLVTAKHGMQWIREPLMAMFLAAGLYAALVIWQVPFEIVLVMALLFYRTAVSIAQLQTGYQNLVSSEVYYRRVREKIDAAAAQRETMAGVAAPDFRRAIEFDHVSLALGDRPVLTDVSVSIPAGKITTLYGPSGSGKTTMADLVTGLLSPDSGAVRVDGVDLQQIDIASWRREIGYVPQEMFLFHDSLLTNVTLGDPALTEADAEAALRAAGAWDFVSKLADGMHAVAGERGMALSGGQRQRIAMARALVRKPRLLILDEPTTALDPDTETAICATLQDLAREVTILAVSHQPALLSIADVVVQVSGGAAVTQEAGDAAAGVRA